MKKLFWVNLLILILICSCATNYSSQENTEIVSLAIQLAQKQVACEDYSSAIETYKQAISQVNDYRLFYNMAHVESLAGNFQKASSICQKASVTFPQQETLFDKARLIYLEKAGLYEAAQKTCKKLMENNPSEKELRYRLIDILLQQTKDEDAYQIALELWSEKNFDERTASILYSLKPEEWDVVYRSFKE